MNTSLPLLPFPYVFKLIQEERTEKVLGYPKMKNVIQTDQLVLDPWSTTNITDYGIKLSFFTVKEKKSPLKVIILVFCLV